METKFNQNQIEYLKNSKKKFNLKSIAVYSGGSYLDFNFLLPLEAEINRNKSGINLIIFNSLHEAENRFGSRYSKKKGGVVINGDFFYVAAASGNPKRLNELLSKKIKLLYANSIQRWKEETFHNIINSVETQDCKFHGVLSSIGVESDRVKSHIEDFVNRKQLSGEIYLQDNFSSKNNKLGSETVKQSVLSSLTSKNQDYKYGYQFKRIKKD